MIITMKKIAELAGVSQPVVSAVLNNSGRNRVGAAKRKKIQQLITRYRYIPNPIAQSLVTKKTHVINVVIPSVQFFEDPRNSQTVIGLQAATVRAGYRLFFTSLTTAYQDLRPLEKISADGIIVYYWGPRTLAVINKLKEMGLGRIVAIGQCEAPAMASVYQDNRTAMYTLTKHLLDRGHRAIVYADAFGGDVFHQQGLAGIRQAIKETEDVGFASVKVPTEVDAPDELERSYLIGRKSLPLVLEKAGFRPTAVLYENDVVALGAMDEARRQGIRVPRDLSFTGNGNDFLGRVAHPPLTTVEDKSYEAGLKAGEVLIAMMAEKQPKPASIKISITPIIRSSVNIMKEK